MQICQGVQRILTNPVNVFDELLYQKDIHTRYAIATVKSSHTNWNEGDNQILVSEMLNMQNRLYGKTAAQKAFCRRFGKPCEQLFADPS
jgi:hypothetical protein